MAGLLDFIQTPEGQGLLSAAFGGLAGARRGEPLNNIGRGGLAGIMGYSNAQNRDEEAQRLKLAQAQDARQNSLFDVQLQQHQAQLADLKRQQEYKQRLGELGQQYYTPGAPAQTQVQVPDLFKDPIGAAPQITNTPAVPPRFDQKGYMQAALPQMLANDPHGTMQLLAKGEAPQLVEIADPNNPGMSIKRWVKPGESAGVDVGTAPQKESALPWYVRRTQGGQMEIDPAFADLEKTKASYGRPPAAPMQPVAYVDAKGNTVWGTITDARGRPAANYNPAVKGDLAFAAGSGRERGEAQGKAESGLPSVIAQTEEAIKLTDDLLKHPGMAQAVGKSSLMGIQYVPGTDAKAFMIRLNQLKGKQFLEAYNTLKGGGQITEVEGKKATEAMARMDNASTEDEFSAAAREWQDVLKAGIGRARQKAGQPVADAQQGNPTSQPKSKQFSVGNRKVLGTLGDDGAYYVMQGGKRYRVEE